MPLRTNDSLKASGGPSRGGESAIHTSSSGLHSSRAPITHTQIGRYQIVERLGRGNVETATVGTDPQVNSLIEKRYRRRFPSIVYKAIDTKTAHPVALKIVPSYTNYTPEAFALFQRDAEMTRQVSHSNVGVIQDASSHALAPYIVMEHLVGTDLARRIRYQSSMMISEDGRLAKGPMNLRDTLSIIRQVAHGLRAAHRKKLYHGDLKPTNVWVTPKGHVTILDFGLAKLSKYDDATYDQDAEAACQNDLFSLGCLFYLLLTGVSPYIDAAGNIFSRADLSSTPPKVAPIAHFRRDVSPEIEECLRRLFVPHLASRFRTVDEFITTLSGATSRWDTMLQWCRDRLWMVGAVAAMSFVLIVLTSWLTCESRRDFASDNAAAPSHAADGATPSDESDESDPPTFPATSLFTYDGTRVIDGNDTGLIREWDTVAGRETQRWSGHDEAICALTISGNGRWLASADAGGLLCLWDYGNGALIWSEKVTAGDVRSLWVASSGNRLLVLIHDGESFSLLEYQP